MLTRPARLVAIPLMIGGAACTSLGPTPVTSGVSAMPAARPEVSASGAIAPGYYLSSATREVAQGTSIPALALLLEPDRLLEIPGVLLGARVYGGESDNGFEPMLGYRRRLGSAQPIGVGVVASFTRTSATDKQASYEASRGTVEAIAELRLARLGRWLDVSLTGGLSATALDAVGSYCADAEGFGRDCDGAEGTNTDAELSGLFVAGTGGLAVDLGRASRSWFHGVRVVLSGTVGSMPTVRAGEQESARSYHAVGLSVGSSFGADGAAKR